LPSSPLLLLLCRGHVLQLLLLLRRGLQLLPRQLLLLLNVWQRATAWQDGDLKVTWAFQVTSSSSIHT
jgi:hypothetical protein